MRVGDIEVLPVHDGTAYFDPTDAFAGTSAADWESHRQFLTDDGQLALGLGGVLVRCGDRTVLVDAGVGPYTIGEFVGGALLDSLGAVGVGPADVTDVMFTHLHFDHVGWSTQKGAIVFPNATYRCHERDWAHFVGPDAG